MLRKQRTCLLGHDWATTAPQRKAGFRREGKTGIPGGKRLKAEKRTNKLNPHMTPSLEIEPGPHWCDANALTTTPPLHRWDAVSVHLCWDHPQFINLIAYIHYLLIIDSHNDQLPVGLIDHLVEHCTDIAEVRIRLPFSPDFFRPFFRNVGCVAPSPCRPKLLLPTLRYVSQNGEDLFKCQENLYKFQVYMLL